MRNDPPSAPTPPAPVTPDAEEDAPLPRGRPRIGREQTVALDAVTRVHPAASPKTESLVEPPVRLVRGPTEHVDGPTSLLAAAENDVLVAGPQTSSSRPGLVDTTRVVAASSSVQSAAEALVVDGKPHVAQVLSGIAAALVGSAPCGAMEAAFCRLTKELLLVDYGIGGRFEADDLGRLLVEIATGVLVGIDPYRKAALDLARQCEAKAASYRQAARDAWIVGTGAKPEAVDRVIFSYEQRADELEHQVIELRRQAG